MRRTLAVLVAAALLVGGGVAFALLADEGSAAAQEEPTSTEAPAETERSGDTASGDTASGDTASGDTASGDTGFVRPERGTILADVLEDLVTDGVITDDQAEQITAAWRTRIEELRTQFEARRGERGFGAHEFGLRELLADGVIDADELAELGPDHPFNDPDGPAAEFLDDGELSQDELAELHGSSNHRNRSELGDGG